MLTGKTVLNVAVRSMTTTAMFVFTIGVWYYGLFNLGKLFLNSEGSFFLCVGWFIASLFSKRV